MSNPWLCAFCIVIFSSLLLAAAAPGSEEAILQELCKDTTLEPEKTINNYRFDSQRKKCYSWGYGVENPCGKNMVFKFQVTNSIYGNCECEDELRTLIYHPQTDQCYFIFKQGYCPPGYWLTLSRPSGKPTCEVNPCHDHRIGNKGKGKRESALEEAEFVMFNNRCVKLGSNAPECPGDLIVEFNAGRILPHCRNRYAGRGAVGAPKASVEPCDPGSFLSVSGRCAASYVW